MDDIKGFKGVYFFLSNFSRHQASYGEWTFSTVEHGFQAAKALGHPETFHRIRTAEHPKDAKNLGRRVQLQGDWTQRRRYQVMRTLLKSKFDNPELTRKLLATGDALLVESNEWCDNVWGDCICGHPRCRDRGLNLLGDMLMDLRDTKRRA